LANPSYGEADPRAWAISAVRGGNPGQMDAQPPVDPASKVVMNEVLAHTDLPQLDTVELYNGSTQPADVSGCVLTADVRTNRFRIPAGTVLAPGGFLALDERVLGFRLSAAGESVWLISSNGVRVVDVVRFGAQENGVASGRTPDGSSGWRRLESFTPGKANAVRRLEDVVLNEIMYHPISDDDADDDLEGRRGTGATGPPLGPCVLLVTRASLLVVHVARSSGACTLVAAVPARSVVAVQCARPPGGGGVEPTITAGGALCDRHTVTAGGALCDRH
jgi:hypothetical protein